MSKHCISKIIIVQLSRPFPGEMLKNELRTKQSTEKLWACEPKVKWVLNTRLVMRQTGRQETLEQGSHGLWRLLTTVLIGMIYIAWGSQRGPGNDNIQKNL